MLFVLDWERRPSSGEPSGCSWSVQGLEAGWGDGSGGQRQRGLNHHHRPQPQLAV